MDAIEIVILILGIVLVVATYIFSEKFDSNKVDLTNNVTDMTKELTEELVRAEVDRELANIIDEKIEAASVELDKIANEKIMAVGSYSDDILEKIDKNHDEVMFLYNMLNEKENTLKDTIRDIEALKLSIKKMALVSDMSANMAKKKDNTVVTKAPQSQRENKEKKVTVAEKTAGNEMENYLASHEEANQKMSAQADGKSVNADIELKSVEEEALPFRRERNIKATTGNKNEDVLRLHSEGLSNMEIAKKMGMGIGEVRLVIDLFKKEG